MGACGKYVTVPQLANEWSVCRATVHRWIVRGIGGVKLPAIRVGHGWRIDPKAVDEFFAKLAARTTGENEREERPESLPVSADERRKRIERAMAGLREKGV